ncbi:MAG: hypothetical protein INR68_16920 [Methylobacterium mesophilicum]|nr:hypothetical protein [Methylobacterium mesophilicum]
MALVDPSLIGFVSAGTALTASIAGPLVTLYVARAQIRAAVRSANRQRWIEEFRDTVAKFCGQIAVATQLRESIVAKGHVSIPVESKALQQFEQLIYTGAKLRMMVNPLDGEHRTLLAAIDDLLALFREDAVQDDFQNKARERAMGITQMSLGIIRHEWLHVQNGD